MKSNNVEYDLIKKRAQDRDDWRHWRPGLPEKAEHTRDSGRERKREREKEREREREICLVNAAY